MIEIEQLQFAWGRSQLFRAFGAHIQQPGVYGLFGRNGSGKSTLLKLISGLLHPDAGSIRVLGWRPEDRAAEFLSQIYILPEEFHLPDLTPQQLAATHAAFYPDFSHAAYGRNLAILQVPTDLRFGRMSLGQKKKAAIAFALATCTPVLLMDEPTNGLDIVSRSQFKSLLQSPEQAGRVILISTHQAHDLESVLQHIWFIDGGQLVLSSSMAALSGQLRMGVALQAADLPAAADLLYQESLGAHTAWVAKADASSPAANTSPIQLELLYKALSLNQSGVLAASTTAEIEHIVFRGSNPMEPLAASTAAAHSSAGGQT
jgi:ABC-2 type transport system ATP-binding protein